MSDLESLPRVMDDPKASQRLMLLRRALEQRPDSAMLHARVGAEHADAGRFTDAVESFGRAVELDPRSADAQFGLGRTLARLNRDVEAEGALRATLALAPGHFHALHHLVRILVRRGDPEAALVACDESERRVPGNPSALGVRSQVLVALGRSDDLAALMDFDRLLHVETLKPPTGWLHLNSFNAALAESICANPRLTFEPRGVATRGGHQASLSSEGDRPEAALYRAVQSAMDAYCARIARAPGHPFQRNAPTRSRLVMWTVVLHQGGRQTAHIHPDAWLSGVYYVKVPDTGDDRAGQLVLGCRDRDLVSSAETPVRYVRPEPGLLTLFPAFYYHETVPTKSSDERICVAFNLMAAE